MHVKRTEITGPRENIKSDKHVKRIEITGPRNCPVVEERSYPESSTLSRGILEQSLSSEQERWEGGGGNHPVINLKELNEFVPNEHFEGLHCL